MVIALVILILAVCGLWIFAQRCRRGHEAWPKLRRFRYAHRGYHNKPTVPENSMAAFRAAVEHGWGAELDVHLMKDGNLAVIHDASLKRTAGADVLIEDLTKADLANYVLEESFEPIPLLEHVLAVFEGKTPLIIELKSENGNHAALSEAVAKMLDKYPGDYCIESFDPRVVAWFAKHRPNVCRGQLSQNFLNTDHNLSRSTKFVLTNLLMNLLACPDFVAYKFDDRKNFGVSLCRKLWKPVEVAWTIRKKEDMETAEAEGKLVIFEHFDPESESLPLTREPKSSDLV